MASKNEKMLSLILWWIVCQKKQFRWRMERRTNLRVPLFGATKYYLIVFNSISTPHDVHMCGAPTHLFRGAFFAFCFNVFFSFFFLFLLFWMKQMRCWAEIEICKEIYFSGCWWWQWWYNTTYPPHHTSSSVLFVFAGVRVGDIQIAWVHGSCMRCMHAAARLF